MPGEVIRIRVSETFQNGTNTATAPADSRPVLTDVSHEGTKPRSDGPDRYVALRLRVRILIRGSQCAREACLFWTRNRTFGADQRRKRSEQTIFGCACGLAGASPSRTATTLPRRNIALPERHPSAQRARAGSAADSGRSECEWRETRALRGGSGNRHAA
jgi:hypothetical protein